jgi:hypothetical protein
VNRTAALVYHQLAGGVCPGVEIQEAVEIARQTEVWTLALSARLMLLSRR